MMINRLSVALFCALPGLLLTGCNSHSDQQETVTEHRSIQSRVADYKSSDPNLPPTLTIGDYLEVRTKDGGPVVLQSQVDKQRRAAEQQRVQNELNATPAVVVPSDTK
jgi:hypothetical protein